MGQYFDKFPRIAYDITRNGKTRNVLFTNILFRIGILDKIKKNVYSYYDYVIPEGLSIENLAEKYYGNPELHWVIMLANDMTDPHYDWPLDQASFSKYIIDKYGSIPTAQTRIAKYKKVITRTHLSTGTKDIIKLEINEDAYNDLASSSLITYTLEDGTSVEELITKESQDCYDWESEQNDERRYIKLIKPEYIPRIEAEFNSLTSIKPSGYRTLRERL